MSDIDDDVCPFCDELEEDCVCEDDDDADILDEEEDDNDD